MAVSLKGPSEGPFSIETGKDLVHCLFGRFSPYHELERLNRVHILRFRVGTDEEVVAEAGDGDEAGDDRPSGWGDLGRHPRLLWMSVRIDAQG